MSGMLDASHRHMPAEIPVDTSEQREKEKNTTVYLYFLFHQILKYHDDSLLSFFMIPYRRFMKKSNKTGSQSLRFHGFLKSYFPFRFVPFSSSSRPSGSFPVTQYGKILKKNEILLNFRFHFSYNGLLFQIRRVACAKQNGFIRETLIYT